MRATIAIALALAAMAVGCSTAGTGMNGAKKLTLDYETPVDPKLQRDIEAIDGALRATHSMTADQSAVGVLDLTTARLAMIHPDRIEYAASVPKIAILLAWFHAHPDAVKQLDPAVRHELGLMIKISSNEMAAKYSRLIGLKRIRQIVERDGFYDAQRGGGIWVGKHYGKDSERYPDPVGGHSHAATVRQLLRFYLALEQGRLVSPEASRVMRDIFESPAIPHDNMKFVKGLEGRGAEIIRKSGSWENWLHDTAVVRGGGRHYILVALTRHPKGDEYLVDLARAVDDLLAAPK